VPDVFFPPDPDPDPDPDSYTADPENRIWKTETISLNPKSAIVFNKLRK